MKLVCHEPPMQSLFCCATTYCVLRYWISVALSSIPQQSSYMLIVAYMPRYDHVASSHAFPCAKATAAYMVFVSIDYFRAICPASCTAPGCMLTTWRAAVR